MGTAIASSVRNVFSADMQLADNNENKIVEAVWDSANYFKNVIATMWLRRSKENIATSSNSTVCILGKYVWTLET